MEVRGGDVGGRGEGGGGERGVGRGSPAAAAAVAAGKAKGKGRHVCVYVSRRGGWEVSTWMVGAWRARKGTNAGPFWAAARPWLLVGLSTSCLSNGGVGRRV